jgi:sRNA-binding protein
MLNEKGPGAGDAGPSGEPDNKPQNKSPNPLPQGLAWKKSAIQTIDIFRARVPRCFARHHPIPLKIGIHLDIAAALPELPTTDIGRGLKFYVSRFVYLESCIEGATRIDLNGDPAGVVSAAEAANAQRWLAKRRKGRTAPLLQPLMRRACATSQACAISSAPPASPPKKLTLDDLRAAARKRTAMA